MVTQNTGINAEKSVIDDISAGMYHAVNSNLKKRCIIYGKAYIERAPALIDINSDWPALIVFGFCYFT